MIRALNEKPKQMRQECAGYSLYVHVPFGRSLLEILGYASRSRVAKTVYFDRMCIGNGFIIANNSIWHSWLGKQAHAQMFAWFYSIAMHRNFKLADSLSVLDTSGIRLSVFDASTL